MFTSPSFLLTDSFKLVSRMSKKAQVRKEGSESGGRRVKTGEHRRSNMQMQDRRKVWKSSSSPDLPLPGCGSAGSKINTVSIGTGVFLPSATYTKPDPKKKPADVWTMSKRMLLCYSIIGAVLPFDVFSKAQAFELQRYTDSKEGFTLLTPYSWIQVDKAGATVLFEEPNKGSNNLGVVVSPARISKLSEFGSPDFVADKLIQAEKRKESTKDAVVISVSKRSGQGGLEVYEFEYKVDSTRGGLKRVFSAAFIASKKLYLLNISHSDGLESPLDMDQRLVLERVLHSFDTSPYT